MSALFAPSAESFSVDLRRPTVLLVDDTPSLAAGREVLESIGLRVLATSMASDVVELLFCQKLDLLMIDLNLRSLRGDALVRVIRAVANGKQARVLLMTALDVETICRRASECMADGWVRKPLVAREIRQRLRELGVLLPTSGDGIDLHRPFAGAEDARSIPPATPSTDSIPLIAAVTPLDAAPDEPSELHRPGGLL